MMIFVMNTEYIYVKHIEKTIETYTCMYLAHLWSVILLLDSP
jgi:hypothetical protein